MQSLVYKGNRLLNSSNLVYQLIWCVQSNGGNEDIVDDDCSAKSASAMINNYKRKEAEELNNKLAKKADIESVNQVSCQN